MSAATVEALQQAVEKLHDCRSIFSHTEHVHETFQDQTVWEGTVHIFDLEGHATASVAYAWSDEAKGSERRHFYAILHDGPVQSATDAVRAFIAEAYHSKS